MKAKGDNSGVWRGRSNLNQRKEIDVTPILGHLLSRRAVELTEAIDVVFFRGGYAEIKGLSLVKICSGFSCLKMS